MPLLRPWQSRSKGLPRALQYHPATAIDVPSIVEKATTLLYHHLDEKQRTDLTKTGKFIVTGSNGGKYWIRMDGNSYTVHNEIISYCVHAFGYNGTPAFYIGTDSVVAILLTLRTNETAFLRIAIPYGPAPFLREDGDYLWAARRRYQEATMAMRRHYLG